MKIIADENIPFVKVAFATLGEVITLPGRAIKQSDLEFSDVLLTRSVTQVNRSLLKDTSIKFVASATSGINHIDLAYLREQGIEFTHALGSNAIAVAEYVISAIAYWSLTKNKSLNQMTLGIIGCGQIGSQVNKLAHKLGIKTVLNDPPLAATNPQLQWSTLKFALSCDMVSLHVPLTAIGKHATNNLINQQHINQLQPGTLLINTSRGEVFDENAWLVRQKKQQDLNLVLDVWQNEPDINIEMLAHTLIATPHIAGYSYDGKIRGIEIIYKACCKYLNCKPLWSVDNSKCDIQAPKAITLSTTQDMRSKILKAYDIIQDNNRLKQFIGSPEPVIDLYFDALRKNYSIRREWSQITP